MDRINQKNLDGTTKNFQVTILVSSKYLRVKSCIFGSSQLQWWLWQSHILAVGLLIRGSYWRLWTSQFLKVFPNALNVENLAAMQWSWNIKPNYCNISLILGGGQCIRLKGSKIKKSIDSHSILLTKSLWSETFSILALELYRLKGSFSKRKGRKSLKGAHGGTFFSCSLFYNIQITLIFKRMIQPCKSHYILVSIWNIFELKHWTNGGWMGRRALHPNIV